jgi:hypothetical protein
LCPEISSQCLIKLLFVVLHLKPFIIA